MRLLLLMQQGQAGNAIALAEILGVTERTVYRDLEVLTDLGVPCYFDDDAGGYRVRKDFFLPPVQLTAAEALALFSLAESIGRQAQIPMTGPALCALEKIRGQLPHRVLDELGTLDGRVAVQLPATGPDERVIDVVFDRVREAIRQRRMLRCRYESLNDRSDASEFLFQPFSLVFDQRAWYAIGHHDGRGEVRRLKLNRFTAVLPTDAPYIIPDDFSLAEYRGKAWRMIRGEQTHRVAIDFDADVAETVADTHWHATQRVEEHADGSATFHCEVDGLDEIVWWVLGYGPHARVREPAALADRVAELAKQTGARYSTNPMLPR